MKTISISNSFVVPAPVRYEFQVAEYIDPSVIGGSKPWKVELQMRTIEMDQYGNDYLTGTWITVPRIQIMCPEIKN